MGPLQLSSHVQPMNSATTLSLDTSPLSDCAHQSVSTIVSSNTIILSSIVTLETQPIVSSNATVTTVPLTTPSLVPATINTVNVNCGPLPILLVTNFTSAASLSSASSSIVTPEQRSHVHASSQSANSRLFKLTLPTFSGDS